MKYNKNIVKAYFQECGLPEPKFEYEFHPFRKWRFDIAWSCEKLYIEIDGGIWIGGGHNRGARMKKDWDKRNAASIYGWRGLWFEPKDLCLEHTINTIRFCLHKYRTLSACTALPCLIRPACSGASQMPEKK